MRGFLRHRGPDAGGEYDHSPVTLGVQRLAVIDLTSGGQPQSNEDQSIWTVFNGEIYNYRRLRAELRATGHSFRTDSDTEVIVHAYEEDGPNFVRRLDGMFAIALWDESRRTLFLARDRLGKKPLLYAARSGMFAFASEHVALLAALGVERRPNLEAITPFLANGFVPQTTDAFMGVAKLPPASILQWRAGSVTIRRYWHPPRVSLDNYQAADAVERVRDLVRDAVRSRLVADVPLGAFLSGGLDSSVVVGVMAEQISSVRTFTIGFSNERFSEIPKAALVAKHFDTEHHSFVVSPMDVAGILPRIVAHYGEPYADSSAIPTAFLSQLTRQFVTVALNGDGGDEVFGGYDRYQALRLAGWIDRLPRSVRSQMAKSEVLLATGRFARARRFLQGLPLTRQARYSSWVGIFSESQISEILTGDFRAVVGHPERPETSTQDPVTYAQLRDLDEYLPDDLLVKTDIASMMFSLEVRSPLLDRELLEFVLSLPVDLRTPGMRPKHLLKEAFRGILPASVVARRKQGFAVPLAEWIRGDLRGLVIETVLSDRAMNRGYFRREMVTQLVNNHMTGRDENQHRIWALFMLELWHRHFFDQPVGD